jgi:23S rRNA pseudouridine955/2504/2580 synthase
MQSADEGKVFVAGTEDSGRRLDKVLRSLLVEASLSEIYAALRKGGIRLNEARATPDIRLVAGDRIYIKTALLPPLCSPESRTSTADDLDSIRDILVLATEDLLFVNKPRGVLSQGAEGLEVRIRKALSGRSASSLSFAPGPLHRLDRNTTGILTFPRSAAGARAFSGMIRDRRVIKRYLALVEGVVRSPAQWRDRIVRDGAARKSAVSEGGEEAHAYIEPLVRRRDLSLILVELHTGLTHQIRVQASSRGIPLAGDRKYGGAPLMGGYILHALSLEFPEPPFPDVPRIVTADLPEAARTRLSSLFGEAPLLAAIKGIIK